MAAGDLVELLREIEEAGIEVWLDGGWGVDALLGEQRREHDDIDLIASLADMPRLLQFLEERRYELVDGELPTNVVLLDSRGARLTFTQSPSMRAATASTGCEMARIGSSLPGVLLEEDAFGS